MLIFRTQYKDGEILYSFVFGVKATALEGNSYSLGDSLHRPPAPCASHIWILVDGVVHIHRVRLLALVVVVRQSTPS